MGHESVRGAGARPRLSTGRDIPQLAPDGPLAGHDLDGSSGRGRSGRFRLDVAQVDVLGLRELLVVAFAEHAAPAPICYRPRLPRRISEGRKAHRLRMSLILARLEAYQFWASLPTTVSVCREEGRRCLRYPISPCRQRIEAQGLSRPRGRLAPWV